MPIVAVNRSSAQPVIRRTDIVARQRVRRPIISNPAAVSDPSPAPALVEVSAPAPAPVVETIVAAEPQPAEPASYEVGYKKPPKKTQFGKGKSGNPKGRPKGAKGLKTIVRELMGEKVVVRTSEGRTKMSRLEALLRKVIENAFTGNARALQSVLQLCSAAMPDETPHLAVASAASAPATIAPADMDAHDVAILETLRATLLAGSGSTS